MSIRPLTPPPMPDRPGFEDCTVTGVDPLRIQRDGDSTELPFEPDTMAPRLNVGDRVRVENADGRLIIHGVEGGPPVGLDTSGALTEASLPADWPLGWTLVDGGPDTSDWFQAYSLIETVSFGASRCRQTLSYKNTGAQWVRSGTGTGWTAWIQTATPA